MATDKSLNLLDENKDTACKGRFTRDVCVRVRVFPWSLPSRS